MTLGAARQFGVISVKVGWLAALICLQPYFPPDVEHGRFKGRQGLGHPGEQRWGVVWPTPATEHV